MTYCVTAHMGTTVPADTDMPQGVHLELQLRGQPQVEATGNVNTFVQTVLSPGLTPVTDIEVAIAQPRLHDIDTPAEAAISICH